MSLTSPLWLLAGLLAGPVILLYLLKMKRRDYPVSSTMLWVQVMADMRASTPFQKLRRNLLLLLQLLILAAIVFSLCRPVMLSGNIEQARQVVIIDASASMQARDVDGGLSRFEAATELAGELIESLDDDDLMMLIVAGPAGRGQRTPFTFNRHELRRALAVAVEEGCYDSPVAISEAVQLAVSSIAAGGGQGPVGNIVLITDGAGVTLPKDARLEGLLKQVLVGASTANTGIVSLGVETTESSRRIVAGIKNFDGQRRKVLVNYYHGQPDNWIDSRELELDPQARGSVVLEKPLAPGRLWLKVQSTGDVLALDDTAYAILPEFRPLKVLLVSKRNPVLTRFLAAAQASGRLEATAIEPEKWGPGLEADFTIFDVCAPEGSEQATGDVLYINPPESVGVFTPTGIMQGPRVVNSIAEDSVLRFVDLSGLEIARAVRYEHGDQATELISAGDGLLLAYTSRGRSRSYLLAFHLADSTWATDSGLLILLSNMLDQAAAAHFVGRGQMVLTGDAADLPIGDQAKQLRVVRPGADVETVPVGINSYSPVELAGFYRVAGADKEHVFAANLLNENESDITPKSLTITTAADNKTEAGQATVTASRRLWPILTIMALAIMLTEWWLFHHPATGVAANPLRGG